MNEPHPSMRAEKYVSNSTPQPPHFQRTTRLRELAKTAATLLLLFFLAAEVRAQSALDGFDPRANDSIRVAVVQPDGKILIGGDFTTLSPNGGATVPRNHIARLNPDGTLDMTFNPNATGDVFTIALQTDGKILVGGSFSGANSIGGQARNRIARLDPVTGLADSFDPNANSSVYSIVVQADGKILAGGNFQGTNSIGGQTRNFIARLDATTGAADSWAPNANNDVLSLVVQADGRILAGGVFDQIGGQTRTKIARLDAATGFADSWNPGADNVVFSIALQADGKILAGGLFGSIGGEARNRIARLDATTGLADSFDPHASHSDPGYQGSVVSIAVQPDGKILAGGFFTNIGGQTRTCIARLDAMTGMADSLNPNAINDLVYSVAVQADGKILVVGLFGGLPRQYIARLEKDGRLDQTLDLNLGGVDGGRIFATSVQPDGKILIGGHFTTVLGVPRNNMARLNTDGTLDTAFDPNVTGPPHGQVRAFALQTDGKVLVAGEFTSVGGQSRNNIARVDGTTGMVDSFDPNASEFVNTLALQADGKILAGGRFNGPNSIGGQTRNFIARLDPTTGLADSFDPNANGIVSSIVVQADGKILVGGTFNDIFVGPITIGGQNRNNIARLDATTGLADSFDPDATYTVDPIAIQPDGKILTGGEFGRIGGEQRSHMARLDPVTGQADSFDPNPTTPNQAAISSIAVQADGKILATGRFEVIGGQTRQDVARLDATGLADSFNPNSSGPSSFGAPLTLQADGKILVGGNFTSIGGQPRNLFARLSNDTPALQTLAATQTSITWTRAGSCPQFTRVTFEYSPDNVNYTPLGHGTPAGSNWTLTGLNLPIAQNIYLRARGYYRSGSWNASESISETVRNAFLTPARFGNISTRVRVGTGDNVMIGGFIITGTQLKTVIVRGIGPSLPVTGALADPVIEVHGPGGQLLGTNDNWRNDANQQQVIDSGIAPPNDLESALWGVIGPGAYTVVVRGTNNTTGIGLFEVYDLDQTVDSRLANVSTRGLVQQGDNVLIGGLIVVGQGPLRTILRAIGPSLPVPEPLPDPTLELYDGNGSLIATNDNWRTDQEAEIIATTIPPPNDLESAIVRDLTPGNYTAIVRGTTGIAVIEAYGLN